MADETPTPNIKRTFIEALRTTPAGILDFLETPIPEPPACTVPADAEAAAIANGICAAYVLDLFRPFAGLTPIELLLRIGQHNSVLEAGLLAGLEYIGESGAQCDFDVISPTDGDVIEMTTAPYLRIESKNGAIANASYSVTSGGEVVKQGALAPVTEDIFIEEQAFNLAAGEYAINFAATYASTNVNKSVSITVTDPNDPNAPPPTTPDDPTLPTPDNPDGDTKTALDIAKAAFDAAYNGAVQAVTTAAGRGTAFALAIQAATTAARTFQACVEKQVAQAQSTVLQAAAQKISDVITTILNDLGSRGVRDIPVLDETMINHLADLANAVETSYSAATQEYFKNNPHPTTGYASGARNLRGAAQAMNEKYGAGSVVTY